MSIKEVISEVNLLLYVIRRNPPYETGEKLQSQAPYVRQMESKTIILPEMSSLLMIQIFDNTVNVLWRSY